LVVHHSCHGTKCSTEHDAPCHGAACRVNYRSTGYGLFLYDDLGKMFANVPLEKALLHDNLQNGGKCSHAGQGNIELAWLLILC
jgi:hypothetical protein